MRIATRGSRFLRASSTRSFHGIRQDSVLVDGYSCKPPGRHMSTPALSQLSCFGIREGTIMRKLCTHLTLATLALLLMGPCGAGPERWKIPDPDDALSLPARPASIKGEFSVVSVGDLIHSDAIAQTPDPDLLDVLTIIRRGDVAIGNQEGVFFEASTFTGEAPGGPYVLVGKAELARDIRSMGIDMVSLANNHSNDWDSAGLIATEGLLDSAGIVHAGDGATLAEARGARFLKTPKGRIALVATASTFKEGARAQDCIDNMPARHGISTLRRREIRVVTRKTMAYLRAAAEKPESSGDLEFDGRIYREGLIPQYVYEMNTFDHHALLTSIRDAKSQADFVVFTIHGHENLDGMDDEAPGAPAGFLVDLSHQAIDVGADMVMGGGPHSLRGIEIYKGKPIFYGLGVFMLTGRIWLTQDERTSFFGPKPAVQLDAPAATARPRGLNPKSWYESFVMETTFHEGKLKWIRLYPLDLGREGGSGRRGVPHLATGAHAQDILAEMQRLSAGFGTRIDITGASGMVRP